MTMENEMADKSRRVITVLTLILLFVLGIGALYVATQHLSAYEPWRTLLNLFGGFLVISIPASILYSLTLKSQDERNRREELRKLLNEKLDTVIIGGQKFGFDGIVGEMDYNALFDGLQREDELWWLDTFPPDYHVLSKHLENAVDRGARVTILATEPKSIVATLRASELHKSMDKKAFLGGLYMFIHDLQEIIKRSVGKTGSLRLGIYKDLPCAPMYVVCRNREPKYGFVSWFLTQPTGIEFPHMKWTSADVSVLKYFYEYMKEKWENCQKLDAETITKTDTT